MSSKGGEIICQNHPSITYLTFQNLWQNGIGKRIKNLILILNCELLVVEKKFGGSVARGMNGKQR